MGTSGCDDPDDTDDLAPLGRVGFVGVGATGGALARALAARGATVATVSTLHPDRARALAEALPRPPQVTTPAGVVAACDLVFLAVPDDIITPLASELDWRAGQVAVHLSGARGIEALAPARAHGARVAAAHPLMTFTRGDGGAGGPSADLFAGCAWALEAGDEETRFLLERLVAALRGTSVTLSARDRVPYHISAVLASNYVVALLGAATRLWSAFGVSQDEALRSLLPLLRAAVEKLAAEGLPDALTGPLARGDTGTVAAHLAWLDDAAGSAPAATGNVGDAGNAGGDPQVVALRDAYRALARLALPIAEAKAALPPETVVRLRALLGEQ